MKMIISKQLFKIYVGVAATLAILRVMSFFYLSHRMQTHTVTAAILNLQYLFYPDLLLFDLTNLPQIREPNLYKAAFVLFHSIGSFIITAPILLLSFVRRPHQPDLKRGV